MNRHLATAIDDLSKVPNINNGGCGISAYVILKYLKKHAPELYTKSSVVYSYRTEEEDEWMNNQMFINKQVTTFADSCSHVLVRVKRSYYDSGGRQWKPSGKIHIVPAAPDGDFGLHMLKMAINMANWASYFERRNCHGISKRLGLRLSELNYPPLEEEYPN